MALVEDGASLGSRQLDMGNSGEKEVSQDMKKRWLMITMLVGALAVGVIGTGVVLAGGNGGEGGSRINDLASRVATILELDEAQVQDAFDQAVSEIREEKLQAKLDSLVANGKLTEDQAQELGDWIRSRPEDLPKELFRGLRGRSFHGGHDWGKHGMRYFDEAPAPAPDATSLSSS